MTRRKKQDGMGQAEMMFQAGLITIAEAAALAGVAKVSIYRFVHHAGVKIQRAGRSIYVDAKDLAEKVYADAPVIQAAILAGLKDRTKGGRR